ncbi:ABC transporter substrate-binding protein [Oceanobacillus manasiensis]|uniref:ABC transporter substrate-binding protein n=1 Tax=Oceanobacillus manasiensis TaxID=586413 RepID=UPI0005A87827|nr:ABC transporter substrate-binding protein [Oceanobacillus manasiensis]
MKKTIGIILFIMLASVGLAACGTSDEASGNSDQKDKVLKMATSADFPPFESRDKEGNFEGFDIDLANLVAEELGYELKIEDMKFDGLIGALQADRVDMVMSGMSSTDERKENVDFSNPYHHSGEMFVTPSDSAIENLEDLEGKTIGVQLGTIQEEGAETLSEEYGFEVKKVDDAGLIIQELNSNRIDAGYMDKTVATGFIKEQELIGFDDPTTSSPGMGIAFPKGSEMVTEVNEVLEKLEEEGKIQELEEKWLSDME